MWEAVERVCFLFRIFPSSGEDLPISAGPGSRSGDVQAALGDDIATATASTAAEEIAVSDLRAKAWVSAVIAQLDSNTTGDFQAKWFGGSGSLSDDQVRERISLTMNFIERELTDGLRYVYPADVALQSQCTSSGVDAYIWKFASDAEGYAETQGPLCDSTDDGLTKQCGVDEAGRYYVYLCTSWYNSLNQNERSSALITQAVKHAGPGDKTQDISTMQQMSQADQLNNAANYQNFALDVAQAAWGCPDNATVTGLPFTCGASPCTCAAFADMCDHWQHGGSVRAQCPATCGECSALEAQVPSPSIQPSPISSPIVEPTPSEFPLNCSETAEEHTLTIDAQNYTGTCEAFAWNDFCAHASVEFLCPVSCGVCVPPGCEEDANYNCQSWHGYVCWDSVKPHCPMTCGEPGCTR